MQSKILDRITWSQEWIELKDPKKQQLEELLHKWFIPKEWVHDDSVENSVRITIEKIKSALGKKANKSKGFDFIHNSLSKSISNTPTAPLEIIEKFGPEDSILCSEINKNRDTSEEYLSYFHSILTSNNHIHIRNLFNILYILSRETLKQTPKNQMQEILWYLIKKINNGNNGIDSQAIWSALYGLQNLDSSVVTKELIHTLTTKINQSNAQLNGQAIWNALYGLQSLDSSVVTKELIHALTTKINQSNAGLNGQAIWNALYGLQNLDSSVVTKELIHALTTKISQSNAELNRQAIWNALYGLQNPDSSVVTKELIHALTTKIKKSNTQLNGQNIWNALYGLYYFNWKQKDISDVIKNLQDYFLHELELLNESELSKEDSNYLAHIYPLYKKETPRYIQYYNGNSGITENNLFHAVKGIFSDAKKGQVIDGVEMDIYIPSISLNIESDGKHHYWNKIFRDGKRDQFLLDMHDISTIRIGPSQDINLMQNKAVKTIAAMFQKRYANIVNT